MSVQISWHSLCTFSALMVVRGLCNQLDLGTRRAALEQVAAWSWSLRLRIQRGSGVCARFEEVERSQKAHQCRARRQSRSWRQKAWRTSRSVTSTLEDLSLFVSEGGFAGASTGASHGPLTYNHVTHVALLNLLRPVKRSRFLFSFQNTFSSFEFSGISLFPNLRISSQSCRS